jgi:uncharacterized membrane protein
MPDSFRILTVTTAIGCVLVAGVFFAFSTFVMRGLNRLPSAQGLQAMQSINITAINPLFMLALFGTGAACLSLAIWSLTNLGASQSPLLIGAAVLYLVGVIGLTIGYHVPHNDTLAAMHATAPGAAEKWKHYATGWTTWNHVRTIAPLISTMLLIAALSRQD